VNDFRLSELLAAISLAADLGTGQPLGHTLHTCRLSLAVARELGLDAEATHDVYDVALLRFLGCTADAPEMAHYAGGDNIALMAAMAPVHEGSPRESMPVLLRSIGQGQRAGRLRLLAEAMKDSRALVSHCEVGARLASRLGMGPSVVSALRHAYERWDGHGLPDGLAGEAVPLPIRIVAPARDAVLWNRLEGAGAAAQVLARRRTKAYDPRVVDAILRIGISPPPRVRVWEELLEAEPEPVHRISAATLDHALLAVADFSDLRSRWTRGRSRRVSQTAAAAGRAWGLSEDEARLLRRAGCVADLGSVGIPAGIWDDPAPLGVDDVERVRLHPYFTERVLTRCRGLADVAALAGAHHERLDGSGYCRGAKGAGVSRSARVLAAADVWTALGEERAHRPALSAGPARDAMRVMVRDGRLDGTAVDAVLSTAGHGGFSAAAVAHAPRPAGLTDREVEVLRLIAQGLTNRAVGARLSISAKTVGHHVESVYSKIDVSTRPAAALFAMEHGLLLG
jgi:HD-GYP domain-containing protein (c-di-GMP phosphodiesterase class II)